MTIEITDALHSLTPNAEWTAVGDEINWLDGSQTKPTQAELDAEVIDCI